MNDNRPPSLETWIGKNALGIIAAILVVMGLALLGSSFIPYAPDWLKATLVALFAALLTAGGIVAVRHRANPFSIALLICGTAALLVSIALAHSAFHVISDTAAFVLIALWGFACFGLAWSLRSLSLSISTMAICALLGFAPLAMTTPFEGLDMIVGAGWIAMFAAVTWWIIDHRDVTTSLPLDTRNAHIATLVCSEVALLFLGEASTFEYSFAIAVALAVAGTLVLAHLSAAKTDVRYYVPLRINEITVGLISALIVSLAPSDGPDWVRIVLYGIAFACIIALTITRINELPIAQMGSAARNPGLLVAGALLPTFFTTGYLSGLTPFLNESAAFSAVLMVCALIAIAVGFRFHAAPLRLFGLVMTLLCVLKLVTIDIAGMDNTIARALALVIGGLVCFGIGALYNYVNRKFEADENRV